MVYILLGTGFEEVEAIAPCDILRRGGVEVAFAGIGGQLVTGSHGIAVKAGTPEPIVKALSEAIQKTLSDDKVQQSLKARGAQPIFCTPTEFSDFVQRKKKKWTDLVKTSRTSLD